MKVAAVQMRSLPGDISKNIEKHVKFIEMAISKKARLVIFPELSITGYEPKLAQELATTREDPRFNVFQNLSDSKRITIGVGMPLRISSGIQIGMIIFAPQVPRITYSKQLLHEDELPYFVAGTEEIFIQVDQFKIAPAICYESLQLEHAEKAFKNGATVYVASVAKSARGTEKAFRHYPAVSKKFSVPVMMANSVGPSDDFVGFGMSSVWNRNGELISQLGEVEEGILILDLQNQTADKCVG